MSTTTTKYKLIKPELSDPANITAFNENWDIIDEQLSELAEGGGEYLPLSGGALTGPLTVIDNFNVNKTYDSVEYKTYVRPINYSIGNNGDYSAGILLYKGDANQAQLMFNKDGVMLRNNVASKAYQLFGQHNASVAATSIRSHLYTYNVYDLFAGRDILNDGEMYLQYE